jgi:hypothetical protein
LHPKIAPQPKSLIYILFFFFGGQKIKRRDKERIKNKKKIKRKLKIKKLYLAPVATFPAPQGLHPK